MVKPDQDLVEEVKKGQVTSFSVLVQRHQRVLLQLALRMTRELELAEDVVQDSFIKAFQKIHLFEGRSSFKSWMYRIVINTAKNKMRRGRREVVDLEKIQVAVASMEEYNLSIKDARGLIQKEIEDLPPKQKMALNLRIYDDLSFREIATVMECPYDTAKANYRHALMKLRHRFEDDSSLKTLKGLSSKNHMMEARSQLVEAE